MKQIFILMALLIGTTLPSCRKEPDLHKQSVIVDSHPNPTPLDNYIERDFTKPYNIDIVYRHLEREIYRQWVFVPAQYDKSVIFVNLLKYLYIDPYTEVLGKEFMRKYSPKQIVLSGTFVYNPNSDSPFDGFAQNGIKIIFLNMNNFSYKSIDELNVYFGTVYHEAAHLLHQTTSPPVEFEKLSGADYKQDAWNTYWSTESLALSYGFITTYASKDKDEDFAEIISKYIIYSDDEWNAMLTNADRKAYSRAKYTGKQLIERKLDILRSYLIKDWNINLDNLRQAVRKRYPTLLQKDFTQIPS